MALTILNDLKNEIERLYIAGSALAADDPRVKKHIPALNKLGERVPVFKNLADRLTALTQAGASPENLMEAGLILFSVIYSQARSDTGSEVSVFMCQNEPLPVSRLHASEINDILTSVKPRANNCHEKLEFLYLHDHYKDPRLYITFIMCVKQGNEEAAETARQILLSSHNAVIPIIERELDIKGGHGDARLFSILAEKMGKAVLPLSERILSEGSPDVLAAALPTLGGDDKYTKVLNTYAKDRRKIVKEAAEKALRTEGV